MVPSKETLRLITSWLNALSRLVRHKGESPDKEQIAIYATMFGQVLPSDAFCQTSLEAVAREAVWWPDYSTLCKAMTTWWRDGKPPCAPALGFADPVPGLPPMEQHDEICLERHYRICRESPARQMFLESLLRTTSPNAWLRVKPPDPVEATSEEGRRAVAELVAGLTIGPAPFSPKEAPRFAVLKPEPLKAAREAIRKK